VRRFHIPALILGAGIEPVQYGPVASQIDLLPTLLSLMGVDSEHPAIGHDLARNILEHDVTDPGRAIMQFGSSQAYMKGNRVVILQPGKSPGFFTYEQQQLIPATERDDALGEEALAHAIWSMKAYNRHLYRLRGELPASGAGHAGVDRLSVPARSTRAG
jgi:phosphoglycerol transferase MdoB-like AlkP superfamily enzyme